MNGFEIKEYREALEDIFQKETPEEISERKRKARNARARRNRRERESCLRDLGLTKVRGSLGGTYWE
jgi:hypothetical protein